MAAGFEHRAVGCHDINAHSSRSHCLLIVGVHGTNISSGVRTVGKLTLCDLAGSERINKTGATGAADNMWPLNVNHRRYFAAAI
jgi:Kinesin motor domain